MARDDWMTQLRVATYRRDGAAVVALATGRLPEVLQLLGDGLVAALDQHVEGARDAAARCADALRERDWDGDRELADQLDALTGNGPTPMLRPLPVDLEELASILEGDPMHTGGMLDLQTGEVWPQGAIDYALEDGDDVDAPDFEDPDRFLGVHGEGSRDGYRDMVSFLDTVIDPERADRLSIALDGRGAFRRFKDVLARWPGELDRWHAFSDERQRGRARAFLAGAGYRVSP